MDSLGLYPEEEVSFEDNKLLEQQLEAAERKILFAKAKGDLGIFMQYLHPDNNHPADITRSRYILKPHHRLIIDMFQDCVLGKQIFTALSIPPQHGKSTITSHYGPAWEFGRSPHKNIIIGAYSDSFAEKIGSKVRSILQDKRFKDIFPNFKLKRGSESKSFMESEDGGSLLFVGRKGGTTGRPCDLFIIDDPLKDKKEADSPTIRDDVWDWYVSVADTRMHVNSTCFIIHTRWHEDDLIGRLCDPEHPNHDTELAADWRYLNVPALLDDPRDQKVAKALGLGEGEALWEERFPAELLRTRQRRAPKVFSALFQGRPSPEDGDFFTSDMFRLYTIDELPTGLKFYAASDHALTEKESNDATVLLVVGVDKDNHVWIIDCWWERKKTDVVVKQMIKLMQKRRPIIWGAGRDHITKSIGPFLKKEMRKAQVYCNLKELSESKDKTQKSQALQGLMSLGMVHFPKNAPWVQRAKAELMKFPDATHDDFVDALSNIGRLIDRMVRARGPSNDLGASKAPPKEGTIAWVKYSSNQRARLAKLNEIQGGM